MAKLTLEMRVLQRAVEVLGNERALARRLRVPMPALFSWIKGTDTPTRAIFLEAIDILIENGVASSQAGGAVKPPAVGRADEGMSIGKEDSR